MITYLIICNVAVKKHSTILVLDRSNTTTASQEGAHNGAVGTPNRRVEAPSGRFAFDSQNMQVPVQGRCILNAVAVSHHYRPQYIHAAEIHSRTQMCPLAASVGGAAMNQIASKAQFK